MQYYELEAVCSLKKDIHFKKSFFIISRFISFSMFLDENLKNLHYQKRVKYYTFSSFNAQDKNEKRSKIYKKNFLYNFRLRSLDKSFIERMEKLLRKNINNPFFIVKETKYRVKNYKKIDEIYSLTPVIATLKNGDFWTFHRSGDILLLTKLLHNNLEKKYNSFYKDKISAKENFIETLEIKNDKPQTIEIIKNDKPVKLFGNKFKIKPKDDEISQKLAFVALGAGLGEKGSFGGGFCIE